MLKMRMEIIFYGATELSIWLAYGDANDGVFSDVIVPCKYVHQLQQVLRLVGLTDMANNLKI